MTQAIEELEGKLREIEADSILLTREASAYAFLYDEAELLVQSSVIFDPLVQACPKIANSTARYRADYLNNLQRMDNMLVELVDSCIVTHMSFTGGKVQSATASETLQFKDRQLAEKLLDFFPHWHNFYVGLVGEMKESGLTPPQVHSAFYDPDFLTGILKAVHPKKDDAQTYFFKRAEFESLVLKSYLADDGVTSVTRINPENGVLQILPIDNFIDSFCSDLKTLHEDRINSRYS